MNIRQLVKWHRARVLRAAGYRLYDVAGQLGEVARNIFARTAWLEPTMVATWPDDLPTAEPRKPLKICSACGQVLPDDGNRR